MGSWCQAQEHVDKNAESVYSAPTLGFRAEGLEMKKSVFTGTWDSYHKGGLRKSTHNLPLFGLMQDLDRGYLEMNPPYQRGLVWSLEQKQRLINSIVVGVALPAIYIRDLSADKTPFMEILDGKQRLSALHDFINNRFSYDGKLFSSLSTAQQRFWGNEIVPAVRVSELSDADAVELYERLNWGGVPHPAREYREVRR